MNHTLQNSRRWTK